MTWGEFKRRVERNTDVNDDTEIDYIDVGRMIYRDGIEVTVRRDDDGTVSVTICS